MVNDLNIIVLDYRETVIKWLNPELCEIVETSKKNACRKIEVTYPYEEELIMEDDTLWYQQGNKIFVPSINGIKSCLYVINTSYEIDFWKKNTITFEAEEIITELNNDVLYFPENSVITITENQLDEWFGGYYDILGMDSLTSNRKQVTPEGIMTYMSLLRMIEEQTGRIFLTSYENEGNKINRSLYLANPDDVRFVSDTDTLDLNYNLESLEFTKSEEDTYNAMAPIFSNTNTVSAEEVKELGNKVSAHIVSNAELRTENRVDKQYQNLVDSLYSSLEEGEYISGDLPGATSSKSNEELIQEWLDYEVVEGQVIPMIIQQDEEGNTVSTANWNAPFEKSKGELYIKFNGINQTDYNVIYPYNESKSPPKYKVGTENTNETLVEAIYNELALSLLNKITPDYELEIEVKDIQQLLGLDNLGYQLHESLQVRVPNFNYFVPCRITETTKNLHHPGENKIKIETEVTSIFDLQETVIDSENRIISKNDTNDVIGGLLKCGDDALPDQYVVMNIKLVKAYNDDEIEKSGNIQQEIKKFDPYNEYYTFSEEQIANLEKAMRNDYINLGWDEGPYEYKLRDITGTVYSVPQWWCASIYYARNQIYSNNESAFGGNDDKALGKGFFDETVHVHYYPNAEQILKLGIAYSEEKKYYAGMFYAYHEMISSELEQKTGDPVYIPNVVSSERQNGPTCLPASISNITSIFKDYHTEYELSKLMGTTSTGTSRNAANNVMEQIGLKTTIVEATLDNVIKYVGRGVCASIDIDVSKLGEEYYDGFYNTYEESGYHAVIIYDWYYTTSSQNLKVGILDTNIPVFNPHYTALLSPTTDNYVPWNVIQNAINSRYYEGNWIVAPPGVNGHMTIVEETSKNLANYEEVTGSYVITPSFAPEISTYKFGLDAVNNTVKNVLHAICDSNINIDIMSSSDSIETENSVKLENISMWWLRALAYAAAYYYQSHDTEKTSNLLIEASSNSESMKYYEHFNRSIDVVGDYDWFSPCYPQGDNIFGYIVSTLLFELGLCYSPADFVNTGGYNSLSSIGKKVVDKAGKTSSSENYLNMFTVNLSQENITKYLKKSAYHDSYMTTVALVYAQSTTLNTTAYKKQDYYPVLLYNKNGSNVDYMNILARGNSITNRYNTKSVDATDVTPYGTTSISNLLSWHNSISSSLQAGDKGMMLVISYYSKEELEAL
ncbi:hypothetical protein [Methanosphaera sp.]|uniref:hypothetical protein n=1 Tax=Methanosphaera sp. TaxID=2666342 RepID=UPI0025DD9A83|nr:hypothetical protein [Methanosphaera sp.]